MIVIGLTGSIGMGKSTACLLFKRLGLKVDSADAAVHRLLAPEGKAFAAVARQFPQVVVDGVIDRGALAAIVFAEPARLAVLEAILHPLVAAERRRFLALARKRGDRMVVLDIPLLFERMLQGQVDAIITVSAPCFVQRARVLARPGMDKARYERIVTRQMPDIEKRRRSDYVVHTGGTVGSTLKQLRTILKEIDSGHARNRPRHRNHRPRSPRRA